MGEEVLAADFNTMVQRQVVATFPNAAARDAAIPSPTAGMMCYLATPPALQVYGTSWRSVPSGLLGYAETNADSGQVTSTPSGSVPLQINVTVPAGRRIRLQAHLVMAQVAPPGTASHMRAAIYQDGASLVQSLAYAPSAVVYQGITVGRIINAAAGTHLYQVFVWTDAGGAIIAGTQGMASLIVEDVGAQ